MIEREPDVYEEEDIYAEEEPSGLMLLSDLEGWEFAEGEPDIRGWTVVDEDNESIGKIGDLIVDAQTGEIVFGVVSHGGFLGLGEERTAIPVDRLDIEPDEERIRFLGNADQIKSAPRYYEETADYPMMYDYWQS